MRGFVQTRLFGLAPSALAGTVFFGVPAAVAGTLLAALWVLPANLPPPSVPSENPITEAKRVLGKALFWDEQLSSDNTMACGSCHLPEHGSADPRVGTNPGSNGVFGDPDDVFGSPGVLLAEPGGAYTPDPNYGFAPQVTGRIAGPAIMAAYFTDLFWDGRARSEFTDPQTGLVSVSAFGALESQSVGPPLSTVEMAHPGRDWNQIAAKLATARPLALATDLPPDVAGAINANPTYPALFAAAYGDAAISADRIAKAIATYERTLVPDQTPWDAYTGGNQSALTPAQVRGMHSFDIGGCTFCHFTPTFTDDSFANIGVRPSLEDIGRKAVTGLGVDKGAFKTPSLRNVGLRGRYMHNGQFNNLTDVVRFYGRLPGAATQFTDNLHPAMNQVVVPEAEVPFIVDFMRHGLTDPRVAAGQFPFDRPTLFAQRAAAHIEVLTDSGVPGSGGLVPRVIAVTPPMIGNAEFKLGVHRALAAAQCWLAVSADPPVNGRLVGASTLATIYLSGSGSDGYGTYPLPVSAALFPEGQTRYLQWVIADPNAPGGMAASEAVRLTFFCPAGGCPPTCDPDFNCDGNADQDDVICMINAVAGNPGCECQDPDFNRDGNVDQDDVIAMINVVAGGNCP